MPRHVTVLLLALVTVCCARVGWSAPVLSTDFDGRTVSGSTASNLTWITNGVADPGDLTAMMNPDGLFDTADAQNRFAPDRNIHSEGAWLVDVPVSVGSAAIDLGTVSLDALIYNNAGALQGVARDLDLTVSLLDATMMTIDLDTVTNIFPGGGSVSPNPRPVSFDLSGNTLAANTDYFLRIDAFGQGPGNNAGIDNLAVEGTIQEGAVIPEPSSLATFLLAAAGWGCYRSRR